MAATERAVASGADVGDALRRRNVPATQPDAPQGQPQANDKEKLKKVSYCLHESYDV
jgi:dolichyl-phosphate-mannose-protein mannosyltransferase